MAREEKAGLYIHVPFCKSRCAYCDFYSNAGLTEDAADRYAAALLRAVSTAPRAQADTLYFGGGTPALLGAERLLRLKAALAERFGLTEDAEITLEANPGEVREEELRRLAAGGFTRISFGAQTLRPDLLALLGRRHGPGEVFEAVEAAARAGFSHISADLILGIPGQAERDVRADVKTLSGLPIDHLSAYLLKIEAGTRLAERFPEGIDGDFQADCYLAGCEAAEEAGFRQYEISNFARGAAVSRHNLKYWKLAPYLGFGPSAHSFYGGKRFYFPRDLEGFCEAGNPFALAVGDGPGGDDAERVLLGLRLCEGVDLTKTRAGFAAGVLHRAAPLERIGLCRAEGNRLSLTRAGFLVSNAVIARLLPD